MKRKYPADLHTHTVASGHAYSTLSENIKFAEETGIELLGISDHAPEMPHSTHDYFFLNSTVIPRRFGEVDLLFGVELNIMDKDGSVDLKPYLLERLDYAIASLHPPCIRPADREENTLALINAMRNPYVRIIGHPCDPRYDFDVHRAVSEARDNNVLLELNNASYNPNNGRHGGEALTLEMLAECKKQAMPVILGSDAHFHMTIGDFSRIEPLLEEADFPDELIINRDPAELKKFLKKQEPLT